MPSPSNADDSAMEEEEEEHEQEEEDEEEEDNPNKNTVDVDSDGGSCSTDSDENSAGEGPTRGFRIQLQKDLRESPFAAELHLALISSLRESAEWDSLRRARRQAAAHVALPEATWLEWLHDEASLARECEYGELDELHKAACAACVTSRIWLTRCHLHRQQPAVDPEAVRAVYEEALAVLGVHPSEGPEVWEDYRDFEAGLLAKCTEPSERKELATRVRMLFLRQLVLPLPRLAELQEGHSRFEASLDPTAEGSTALKKAETLARAASAVWRKEREALEQRLLVATRPVVTVELEGTAGQEVESPSQVTAEILAAEEASGDHARIFTAHLRNTKHAPRDASRWRSFADFAGRVLKDPRKAVQVLERAVRDCAASKELWLDLHLEHESAETALPGLRAVLERGIAALRSAPGAAAEQGVQELLLQHADAERRGAARLTVGADRLEAWAKMRGFLAEAVSVAQACDARGSSCCPALLQWMRLEAYAARNAQEVMRVGHELVQRWGCYYNVWSAFIAAVLHSLVDADPYPTLRDLYKRAMGCVSDYPDQMRADYVQFEREFGTLASWRCAADDTARQHSLAQPAGEGGRARNEGEAEAAGVVGNESTAAASTPESSLNCGVTKRPASQAARPVKPPKRRRRSTAAGTDPASAAPAGDAGDAGAPLTAAEASVPAGPLSQPGASEKEGAGAGGSVGDVGGAGAPLTAAGDVGGAGAPLTAAEASVPAGPLSPPRASEKEGAGVGGSVGDVGGAGAPRPPGASEKAATGVGGSVGDSADQPPPQEPEAEEAGGTGSATRVGAVESPSPAEREVVPDAAVPQPSPPESMDTDAPAGLAVSEARQPHVGCHYHQKRLAPDSLGQLSLEAEGERTVHVSNLDWSVDEAQLHRLFSAIEGLQEVRLVRDFLQRSKGYAYIDYDTSEHVAAAVQQLHGTLVNERAMRVARSLPTKPLFEERTLFVQNLNASATEDSVREAFSPMGEVAAVRMPIDALTKVHKGYAYVEFSAADAVEGALAAAGRLEIAGGKVSVSRSIPMKDHRHQTAGNRKDLPQRVNQRKVLEEKMQREDPMRLSAKFPNTVYVKNLAYKVDEGALQGHFAQCGQVKQVLLVRNSQGRSRGFGFVEFDNSAGAQAALLLTDSTLGGRKVVVSRSQRAITQKKQVPGAETEASREHGQNPPGATRPDDMELTETETARAGVPGTKEPTRSAPRGAGMHQPFRLVKEEGELQGSRADAPAKLGGLGGPDGTSSVTQMTNADFRALLAGGRT